MRSSDIRLNAAERDSAAWRKVDLIINTKLTELRAKTENPEVPEAERLGAAWRIKQLKDILKLAEPAKETRPDAGE